MRGHLKPRCPEEAGIGPNSGTSSLLQTHAEGLESIPLLCPTLCHRGGTSSLAPLRGEPPALSSMTTTRSMAEQPQSRLAGFSLGHDYRNSIFQQEGRLRKGLSHDIERSRSEYTQRRNSEGQCQLPAADGFGSGPIFCSSVSLCIPNGSQAP